MNIISLTCLKRRIDFLPKTILSLKNQSIKPDKILLYYQGKREDLQKELLDLEDDLFNINYVDGSLRSYSKYIYAYRSFPNDNIILCDDDIYYIQNFVENLLNGHKKYPNDMICNVYHPMRYDGHSIYRGPIDVKEIRNRNIKTLSGWGTLIPAHFYDGSYFIDEKELTENIKHMPTHDELWLYQNMLLTKNKVYCIGCYKMPFFKSIAIDSKVFKDCLTYRNTKDTVYRYGQVCVDFLNRHGFDFNSYENT